MTTRIGAWLYRILFASGWPRWVLLVCAAALFVALAYFLTDGTDYREDPSALTPRSVQTYVEVNDFDSLLRNAGTWRLWREERRSAPGDQYNRLQVEIAERVGRHVAGLGTKPLRWLVGAGRAAYAVNREEDGGESWALILRVPGAGETLSELAVEPGMTLATLEGTRESGMFKLTKNDSPEGDGNRLVFATIAPWLVISSAETLPRFAKEAVREPAFSLAGSGILPGWGGGASIRGVLTPTDALSPYSAVGGWMAPEARINFVGAFRNGLETTFDTAILTDRVKSGGLWSLFRVVLLIVALACLCLVFAIVLVMVGWGGWLKIRAVRMGIAPVSAPEEAPLSDAFREDAGIGERKESADAQPEVSPIAPGGDDAEQDVKTNLVDKNENFEPIEETPFDGVESTENAPSGDPHDRPRGE